MGEGIRDYRDLLVWQKAKALALDVYRLTESFPRSETYGLTSQIRRAVVSISVNVAEGSSRNHTNEYIQFLYVSLGSTSELETLFDIAQELKFLIDEKAEILRNNIKEVKKMLNALISSLKRKKSLSPNHYPLSTKLSTVLIALCALFTIHYSLFTTPAYANNLAIKKVTLIGQSGAKMASGNTIAYIQFNISGDNSWRFSPELHDAAWVFVKYSVDGGEWKHATITAVDLSAITGTGLIYDLASGNKGVFIYRAGEGSGALSTNGVKFTWAISTDSVSPLANKVVLKVFALEMARIPQGAFYLGSGGAESGAFYKYPTTTNPYQITSEGAITVGTATDNLYYPNPSTYSGDRAGPIPAAFPKGYQAFYIMKYDLTQGQYRDFLNTLTRVQQAARIGTTPALVSGITSVTNRYVMSNTAAISYRNGIRCDATIDTANPIIFYCDLNGNNIPNEPADGEFIACNWLSWVDLAAYADWAGLRPMTELEYEKACRGTAIPTANEYAWGSISITASASGPTNSGANNETAANSANCLYTGGVSGPMRSGFAATSSSSRYSAGASFYGVMDLSGNLWKRPVTVGNSTGRLFTGIHGNGALNTNGNADVDYWPGTDASGAGYRGGSWLHDTTCARASDRHFAALTSASRDYYYGARLARTSP